MFAVPIAGLGCTSTSTVDTLERLIDDTALLVHAGVSGPSASVSVSDEYGSFGPTWHHMFLLRSLQELLSFLRDSCGMVETELPDLASVSNFADGQNRCFLFVPRDESTLSACFLSRWWSSFCAFLGCVAR